VKPVVDIELQTGVDMSVVEFSVKDQEEVVYDHRVLDVHMGLGKKAKHTVVDERSDDLRLRPLCLRIELLSEPIPPRFVRGRDLLEVVLLHGFVEVDDELRIIPSVTS
jgi:hypothetical protein